MAATVAKDPLDVLQAMFNEVLVQTGKAIKASHKDGARSGVSAGAALRTKLPETMKTYHYALDDLESEITRAKAVLLRDLGKLQVARAPVSVPSPVAPPAPMVPEPRQPAAMMMETPSAASHTVNTNVNFKAIKEESKRAPFPDMGMDVVDLSSHTNAPSASPQPPNGNIKPSQEPHAITPVKQSPKPATAIKSSPAPPQPAAVGSTAQKVASPPQQLPITQTAQDSSLNDMLSLSPAGGAATADMTGGELNFTNMEFTLAPPSDGQSQNAPPAPMQDFDLSAFTTQDGEDDLLNLDNLDGGGPSTDPAPADATVGAESKTTDNTAPATNIDPMYDLSNIGNGNIDAMDLDLNLEVDGENNDSTFNDLFYEDADTDMGQFNDAYFGLE
ncbi:hypothetical protein BKA67DRAFT_658642 [Truncatella angustata]|uniref:Uncharacterized protein n=1 Tax=Truncatella angustata TaxID=152316 RepID=A0A9P8ULK0_9PEZI|nr:uncharacterized protein BKA67DRAFT_658642 [Truncatella angustata]KAH6654338.1 hypothetical protein BKA67DRAFT_658642 [Truncatella angustata]KAH8194178.1 hypothetical protein TruAng_011662 [Truncatella angustata]